MEKVLFKAVTEMNSDIYKDFYKFYFRKHYRVFNRVSLVIAILALAAAAFFTVQQYGMMWTLIALWIALVFIIYPRMAYRRPYKRASKTRQTTRFRFYEDYVTEKTKGEETDYNYSELMEVVESKKYIFIFHSEDSISIIVKTEVSDGGSEELCRLLKNKTGKYSTTKMC